MQRSPSQFKWVKHIIVADKKSMCLSITITILKNTHRKDVTTRASVNCGAGMNCINRGFVKRHNLPQHHLPKPIYTRNVDGYYNEAGLIKFITTMFIRINGIIHRVLFHIINCGNGNIILGDPWLRKVNPLINWEQRTLEISEYTDKTHDLNHQNIKV